MPAGPEQHIAANGLPDYPTFRQRLINDCRRLNAPIPDDRLIEAEYEHRRRQRDAQVAAQLGDTCNACWGRQQRTLSLPRRITWDDDDEGLRADYTCHVCGAEWFTGWAWPRTVVFGS